MIISVPRSWNFSHNSLVSSLQSTRDNSWQLQRGKQAGFNSDFVEELDDGDFDGSLVEDSFFPETAFELETFEFNVTFFGTGEREDFGRFDSYVGDGLGIEENAEWDFGDVISVLVGLYSREDEFCRHEVIAGEDANGADCTNERSAGFVAPNKCAAAAKISLGVGTPRPFCAPILISMIDY